MERIGAQAKRAIALLTYGRLVREDLLKELGFRENDQRAVELLGILNEVVIENLDTIVPKYLSEYEIAYGEERSIYPLVGSAKFTMAGIGALHKGDSFIALNLFALAGEGYYRRKTGEGDLWAARCNYDNAFSALPEELRPKTLPLWYTVKE